METSITFVSLDDLNDKEFYKKVNIEKINEPFKGGYIALDCLQRIITIETNPDRARAKSISLCCEHPRVLESEYFNKEFFKNHNKRLEAALSEN